MVQWSRLCLPIWQDSATKGKVGLIPGQGTKTLYGSGQLGPRATITELMHLN